MLVHQDTSTDFAQRPPVPQAYVDTADLVEELTGERPVYFYDVPQGEWTITSSGGMWPDVWGFMRGVPDSGDGVSLMYSLDEGQNGDRCGVWLHLAGAFGEVRLRFDAEDDKLDRKMRKQAFKKLKKAAKMVKPLRV